MQVFRVYLADSRSFTVHSEASRADERIATSPSLVFNRIAGCVHKVVAAPAHCYESPNLSRHSETPTQTTVIKWAD